MSKKFTICWQCLALVRVVRDRLAWHRGPERWQKDDKSGKYAHTRNSCPGSSESPRWVEDGEGAGVNALGRNPAGFCMKCGQHVSDGPNPDCGQCCYSKRIENDK